MMSFPFKKDISVYCGMSGLKGEPVWIQEKRLGNKSSSVGKK